MPINPQIPMDAGPAGAATVNYQIPMETANSIPFQAKPFAPIDVGADQFEAQKRENTIEDFQAQQSDRLEAQRQKELQQRDTMLLQQHVQSGGDLHSSNGLAIAADELKGKLSLPSYESLTKRLDTRQQSEAQFQKALDSKSLDDLKLIKQQTETATQMMNRALSVYDDTLEQTKDPKKAEDAFQASKQVIMQNASEELPQLAPKLKKLSSATADDLRHQMESTDWYSKEIDNKIANKLKEAQTRSADSSSDKKDSDAENSSEKLRQSQERIDNSARKSAQTGTFDKDEAKAYAKKIANYEEPSLSAYAMRTPYGQNVMAEAFKENPNYSAPDYAAKNKAISSFATGKQGDAVRYFGVANSHLDLLSKLGDELRNGPIKGSNQISNFIEKELGLSTAPTTFDAMKQLVATEIGKAVRGSGGGQEERQEMEQKISAATSPEALKSVISSYRDFMTGQINGLEQQYKSSTGLNNFKEKYLSPYERQLAADHTPTTDSSADPRMHVSKAQQGTLDAGRKEILEQELDEVQNRVATAKTPEDKQRATADLAAIERELSGTGGNLPSPGALPTGWTVKVH